MRTVASRADVLALQRLLQHEMPRTWPKNRAGFPKIGLMDRVADNWVRLGWASEDDIMRLSTSNETMIAPSDAAGGTGA